MKNGVHLYAAAAVVGHSDRQGLLDDRIQQGQEDLCSYLRLSPAQSWPAWVTLPGFRQL